MVVFYLINLEKTRAADWPEFRGPTGQGHAVARNLPVEWGYDSTGAFKNIAWKQPIPGRGWSSPSLHRGKLYLTTAVLGGKGTNAGISLRALCVEASNGKILWDHEVFSHPMVTQIHSKNGHASPTPLLEGDHLYIHFGHQGTACLDLGGKILWKNTSLAYSPVHGNGGSPIIVDNALVFSCDGASEPFVVALNKTTGEVIWKTKRETDAKKKFSFSTPLLITVNGQRQIISPGSGAVCAYEPKSGKEIWRARYGEGYSVIPRPVFGHGMIFIGTGYDRPIVMAIRVDGKGDVTDSHVAWTLTKGAPNTPSLILIGDDLYLVSDAGIASCVDAKTGKVHWQERLGGNFSASPIFADGRLYFQNEEGVGTVLKPGKEFQKLATNSLNERTLASYAVTDDAIFIRTEQALFRVQK
ncbi:MAG: PQQ-binding-like beta-propeller repeat protein [Verrucomicrobia bacterium]|nr:PQQ-binding-like beta-propeller repeat protein [Verrucomicrobiota bacterium]